MGRRDAHKIIPHLLSNVFSLAGAIAIAITIYLASFSPIAIAQPASDACLLEAMENASPETTVRQLRASCSELISDGVAASQRRLSVGDRTIIAERQSLDRPYSITPHRPNFVIPISHNATPSQYEDFVDLGNESIDHTEAEFQVSIKFPLAQDIFDGNTDLLVGYTSHSWWQLYNDASAPFRETNYEPEIFLRHYGGPEILGAQVAFWDFGFNHQSNGRSNLDNREISRSWNRLTGTVGFEFGDLAMALKAWYRLPEDDEDDDNPDIHQYLGYGSVEAVYTPNRNTFSLKYRPGTEEDSIEATWSYPINSHLRIFARAFKGYGESLLDYDREVERFGIGFAINDILMR